MRITPWTASLASPVSPQGEHGSSSGSTPKPPAPKNSYCPQFSPIFPIFPNFPTSAHTASAGVDVTHCPRIQTPLNLTAILFCPLRPFRPFPSSPQTPDPKPHTPFYLVAPASASYNASGARSAPFGQHTTPNSSIPTCSNKPGSLSGSNTGPNKRSERSTSPCTVLSSELHS